MVPSLGNFDPIPLGQMVHWKKGRNCRMKRKRRRAREKEAEDEKGGGGEIEEEGFKSTEN